MAIVAFKHTNTEVIYAGTTLRLLYLCTRWYTRKYLDKVVHGYCIV